jgi:hypothetical protein
VAVKIVDSFYETENPGKEESKSQMEISGLLSA